MRLPLDFPANANRAILVPGDSLDSKEKIGVFDDLVEKVAGLVLELFDTSSTISYFVMVISTLLWWLSTFYCSFRHFIWLSFED